MKKLYTVILMMLWLSVCEAQQATQHSLYMLNPYNFNPAYAGLNKSLNASIGYRTQWVGLDGNPKTTFATMDLPLSIISSGVGISFQSESIGARNGLNAKVSYNYIKKIGDGQLSFGASGGIVQGTLDGSKLRTPEGDYTQGTLDHRDNILSLASVRGLVPTFDLGVFYKNEKLEGGLSILNITEPSLKLDGDKAVSATLKRGYMGFIAANFNLLSSITVHPSVMIKSDAVQTQIDFSTFFKYNDNIFLGASFRGYNKNSIDAVAILGGLRLNPKLQLAYSYDLGLSELKNVTQGSHEIMLQYNLGKEFGRGKLPPIIYNPRF
jgi:type IX secretion system PorP/SprF family membrane protein